MTLHLLHCPPDPKVLAVWATRQELLTPDGDYGYAFHALLRAAFGDAAPHPFRYFDARRGLLGYTQASGELLRQGAALAAPDVARALGLDGLDARPFPQAWLAGQRLGFEVRVRPVLRALDGRERDLFLQAIETKLSTERGALLRTDVYRTWLDKQFAQDDAAQIRHANLEAFRLTRVLRRGEANRRPRYISGPDAVFRGELEIRSPAAFADLVRRGIGRHRAFGFGMLLLRPVIRCY